MSSLLMNVYSEIIFKETPLNEKEVIKINGKIVNNIRFADDTVIIASLAEDLQRLPNRTSIYWKKYGFKIIIKTLNIW